MMFRGKRSDTARFKVFKISSQLIFVALILLMCSQMVHGGLAPDFTLTDIDGNTFSLSDFRGKVVIIEFFATWCGSCVDEIPHLKVVRDEFAGRLVMISLSWVDTDEELRRFRDDYDISWIVARDNANVNQEYNITLKPTLYIIDQEGYTRYHHVDVVVEASVLIEEVNGLLGDPVSLTVTTSPSLDAVHFRVCGEDYYTSGGSLSVELEAGRHPVELIDTVVREGDDFEYRFSRWGGIGSGSSNPIQVDITVSSVLEANFGTSYEIVFLQSGSGGTPHVTVDRVSYMLPQAFWFDSGSSHSFSYEKLVNGGTGIRYVLSSASNTSPIKVTNSTSVTGYYEPQYHLDVNTNPSGLNPQPDVSPSGSWYDIGAQVTCTAHAVDGYDFDYWILDGTAQEAGDIELTVTMDTSHNVIARYTAITTQTLTFPVSIADQPFNVVIQSNSTVRVFNFKEEEKTLVFQVEGNFDTTGFCNVSVPESLLGGPYTVKIDDAIVLDNQSPPSNGTHALIYFIYDHSTRTIEIVGRTVMPESTAVRAPVFTLTDVDGIEFSLSDFGGKVVLLDFFATWCGPCVAEIPHLKRLNEEFDEDLIIVSISVSPSSDTVEKVQQFREEHEIDWIVARDTIGVNDGYDVQVVPTLVLIDQEGYIRHRHVDLTDETVLREEIYEIIPESGAWTPITFAFLALALVAFLALALVVIIYKRRERIFLDRATQMVNATPSLSAR